MPGRVPGKCPSIPVPVTLMLPSPGTLACGQALLQHHHLFFSWLCHSAERHPAQPSFVGSKEDRDSEGMGGAAEEELAPVRQGLLFCKTLSRHQQDFGLGGPHTGAWRLCAYCPRMALRWSGQGCRAQPCTVGTSLCYSSTVPQFPFTQLEVFQLPPLPASVAR